MGSTCLPGLCPIATTTICIPPETGQDCPKQDPIPTSGPLSPQETKGRRNLPRSHLALRPSTQVGASRIREKVKMGSGNAAGEGDEGGDQISQDTPKQLLAWK